MKKFIVIISIMLVIGGGILFLLRSTDVLRSSPIFQSDFARNIISSAQVFKPIQRYVDSARDKLFSLQLAQIFRSSSQGGIIYYVDFAGGSDSNDGKSPSTPFKYCPGDPDAKGKADSARLFPGDKVIFKGGIEYKGTVHILWGGEQENKQIVYDGNSAGTFGTGRAIINGEQIRHQGFYCKIKGVKFITINNFEITNMVTDEKRPGETCGILFVWDNENIKINNCYIHKIGMWKNDGKLNISGIGVRLNHPTNCVISGCEITSAGDSGIHILGGVDCIIAGNNIHDYVNWGIDIASDRERGSTGNIVKENIIHDLYQYDIGFWGGKPESAPHQDFVFIRRGDGIRPTGNVVEKNLFYNNYNFTEGGGTAMVFLSHADRNVIRNNILINPHSYFAVSISWGSSDNEFYNNIIYNPRTGGIKIDSVDLGGGTKIKNNIIIANELINWNDKIDEKGWQIDYNYYLSAALTPFHRQKDNVFYPFTQWQNLFGNDAHGGILKSIDDFKFIDIKGYPTACHTMNLRLRADSPIIDKGTLLPGFSNDYLSTVRPQGAAWDIGPHELKATP